MFAGLDPLAASFLDDLLGTEFGQPIFGSEEEEEEEEATKTIAVNIHTTTEYDVYIGRGPGGTVPKSGRGMWGNPFVAGLDGTQERCGSLGSPRPSARTAGSQGA
jgi:hypothetical protein